MTNNVKSNEINLDVLKNGLGLEQDKNTIFFSNENIIVLSPSAQNSAKWFDILLNNANKVRESNKKGLLILRLFKDLLVADLEDFFEKMITENTVVLPKNKQPNWKFNVKSEGNNFYIVNNKNPKFKYLVKKLSEEQLKEEVKRIKGHKVSLPAFNFQRTPSNISQVADNEDISAYIHEYLTSKGFLYSEENIKNLYLSLLSKPFVILSGISGTGKTKIVKLFAEAVGATYENNRFKLIPVRPDWSDSSDLLGYKDLKNDFIKGPLTEMIIKATENPDYPHFVVLDEMNLARVEYYLSDFLSIIESRKFDDKKIIKTAPIVNIGTQENPKEYGFPENLYIIGTVNMDETTHPFSKKVLDRANSIEFNEVDLTNFAFLDRSKEPVEPVEAKNDLFKSKYIQLPDAIEYMDVIKDVSKELEDINTILATIYAQVGYRVRDEIAFYMSYNEEFNLMSRDEAMDFCIMQKILPRISGAGQDVEEALDSLLNLFTGDEPSSLDSNSNLIETAKYPRSTKKLQEMKARYGTQGFVSYWIS